MSSRGLIALLATVPTGLVANAQPLCMFAEEAHLENPAGYPNHFTPDCELAVGYERILTSTNSWIQLHDKLGAPVLPQAKLGNYNDPSTPLYLFPQRALSGLYNAIGDPMVYFDFEHERFWVVAIEVLFDGVSFTYSHIQIAVSTDGTPDDWDDAALVPGGSWRKFDYCLRDVGPSGCSIINGVGHNETMAVDSDSLIISIEAIPQPLEPVWRRRV